MIARTKSSVSWKEKLLNLLFPPKCPFCGKVIERVGVCSSCQDTLPWTEGDDQERIIPGGFPCSAALWYQGAVRQGLLRMKFRGASGSAEPLGRLIAQSASERFSSEFDTVTWTPVSKKRLRQRGYDQARLLALGACAVWSTKPICLLDKVHHNAAQSSLKGGAAERRTNVQNAYRVRAPELVRGRHILLIDDIVTTGSTLSECAKTLKAADAAQVVCAVVARTPLQEDGAPSQVPVEDPAELEEHSLLDEGL